MTNVFLFLLLHVFYFLLADQLIVHIAGRLEVVQRVALFVVLFIFQSISADVFGSVHLLNQVGLVFPVVRLELRIVFNLFH